MDTALLKLVNRDHLEISHDPLHVNLTFTADDIKHYLRSLLHREEGYRLYIDGRAFIGSLEEEITSRGLEVEKGLTIEYEVDENSVPDMSVELEDSVSFLSTRKDPQEIWCGIYGGKLSIYACKSGVISLKETTKHHKARGVVYGDDIYVYTSNELISFRTEDVLFKLSEEITCAASSRGIISVGTHEGGCYVFTDKLMKVSTFETGVSSTIIGEENVEFMSIGGKVGVFTASTGAFKTTSVGYNITSMDSRASVRVLGTPCSELVIEEDGTRLMRTSIRFSSKLAMYNEHIVAQASQYAISILDIKDSRELKRITVGECIAGIAWVENILLVGAGSWIHGYKVHFLE